MTIDVAQALALEGADLAITVPSGDFVTLTDLASNLAALTPSQIDALAATGVSAVTVSNGANLDLSAADAQALEASNLEISGGFDVSDTAANVAANIDALNADANVTSIVLTDCADAGAFARRRAGARRYDGARRDCQPLHDCDCRHGGQRQRQPRGNKYIDRRGTGLFVDQDQRHRPTLFVVRAAVR